MPCATERPMSLRFVVSALLVASMASVTGCAARVSTGDPATEAAESDVTSAKPKPDVTSADEKTALRCTVTTIHDSSVFEESLSVEGEQDDPDAYRHEVVIDRTKSPAHIAIGATTYADGLAGVKIVVATDKAKSVETTTIHLAGGKDTDLTITVTLSDKTKKGEIRQTDSIKRTTVLAADFACP